MSPFPSSPIPPPEIVVGTVEGAKGDILLFAKEWNVPFSPFIHQGHKQSVILSAAKNLGCPRATEILRGAQDDGSRSAMIDLAFPLNNYLTTSKGMAGKVPSKARISCLFPSLVVKVVF